MTQNEQKNLSFVLMIFAIFTTWMIVHNAEHRMFYGNWGNNGDSGFSFGLSIFILTILITLAALL